MISCDLKIQKLLSEHFADDRFQSLNEQLPSPLLEPVVLFHSSAISDIDLEYPDNFKDIKTLSLERLQRTPRLNY